MTVYMEVTTDKYELPVAMADSARELSRMTGAPISTIYKSVSRIKSGEHRRGRFIKVIIEEKTSESV